MAEPDSAALRGTALQIYRPFLKNNKPFGIRAVQRALNLSSPSVAQYHLERLRILDLLKKERGNFIISKVILENSIRVKRFLVPKYIFWFMFAAVILLLELTLLRPPEITMEYSIYTAAMMIFLVFFCYETVKIWSNKRL